MTINLNILTSPKLFRLVPSVIGNASLNCEGLLLYYGIWGLSYRTLLKKIFPYNLDAIKNLEITWR